MDVIKNIGNLRTRNLSQLTNGLLNDYIGKKENYMVLSSVVKKNEKRRNFYYKDLMKKEKEFLYFEEKDNLKYKWTCNIQQIKSSYNGIIFALYYKDCVVYYQVNKKNYMKFRNICNYQHKGNNNEKQFFVNQKNIKEIEKFIIARLYYKDIV